ncbi:multicopper oxidase domain-containing protein [Actinomycetospora soli]|uniref:multicopper oxidase domain-containing protein n=1 Tax=Actinomycetospora soli TaxID=2893887 RepID=UPI00272E5F94|nr:multicopper oxidase domain-containing protein [Actinomycetospora soli]
MPEVDLVALQMPIVYTDDGDHDRDGMLYAPSAHVPLLRWVRARWKENDEQLPRLHRRRQLAQIVVDGLWRYEEMVEILGRKTGQERALLNERTLEDVRAVIDEDAEPEPHADPRWLAVRQNYRVTVAEVLLALRELTAGEVDDMPTTEEERGHLAGVWRSALPGLDAAIRRDLAAVNKRFKAERAQLAQTSGLDLLEVDRLLLNDHSARVSLFPRSSGPYNWINPLRPVPVVRPLVLRVHEGDELRIRLRNELRGRHVGLHVQGDGIAVRIDDGAHVGENPSTLAPPDGGATVSWRCRRQGVWVINDLGDVRGSEQGTNIHGLFGALIVEPKDATWHDPETGKDLTASPWRAGADVDIHLGGAPTKPFVEFPPNGPTESHREFAVFIHDEPEVHSALHLVMKHSTMPLNYRAEPMTNRLPHRMRRLAEETPERPNPAIPVDFAAVYIEIDQDLGEVFHTARTKDGRWLEIVSGEEQHHSSWLFGDPVTPIQRAYAGDPVRVRVVHAGVKETHVYHLHVHQWRAVAEDPKSQLLDAITIGPQTAVTVDPLYGSGSRQHAPGDIIWHCHLYPHFHHGMWGLWRSFDRLVTGDRAYPDGSPCPELKPLPGREPPRPDDVHPGFPWFVDAAVPRKAPPPPAISDDVITGRRALLGMSAHSDQEAAAFVDNPRPGALFVDLDGDAAAWAGGSPRVLSMDVVVREGPVEYNSHGWHDPHGHRYELLGLEVHEPGDQPLRVDVPKTDADGVEPFYVRANHGDVVELRLHNELGTVPHDHFDLEAPPVECGLHVHLVKFDVLAADGSSTGWNYLSGASSPEAVGPNKTGQPARNVSLHRWVVDEEFGPCFFHDHLLANFRQKRGLFAALIAEPHGSSYWAPEDLTRPAWVGAQAVVRKKGMESYREACLSIGDFVPLYDRDRVPLNPPALLGSSDDPGVMGVNYRNAPLRERGDDPSAWFASRVPRADEEPEDVGGEPDTPIVHAYPGDRLRIRLLQGSHEEQHSFVTHGLRWRHEWQNSASRLVDQQTLGISEAFTLEVNQDDSPYGPGDHLWRFAALDDTWLGCWGLVRVHAPGTRPRNDLPALPGRPWTDVQAARAVPPRPEPVRRALPAIGPRPPSAWSLPAARTYVVVARREEIDYSETVSDPWGLTYTLVRGWEPEVVGGHATGRIRATSRLRDDVEPLVLRARAGEWVRVVLINELVTTPFSLAPDDVDPALPRFGPEPHPPELPLEKDRLVSPRVSLHAGLVRYDVVSSDGSWVGLNHDGTIRPLGESPGAHGGHAAEGEDGVARREGHGAAHDRANWVEYWWYADEKLGGGGEGQVCHLQDMADVRNHRHHGLVGALVVEPADAKPTSWTGSHARVTVGDRTTNEQVLVVQDGLRLYRGGNPEEPLRDLVEGDPEDAGQKGINYRSAMVHARRMLAVTEPPTPIWSAAVDEELWLRLVGGCDKPRNHTWTMHGLAWEFAPWVPNGPWVGSLSGLTAGFVRDIVLHPKHPGDHAYRSGAFRYAVQEGLWGILRIEDL